MVKMRRSGKTASFGLSFVSLMGIAFLRSRAYDLYFEQLNLDKRLVATAGWCLATYGPVLLAFFLWRLAKSSRLPWIIHLFLVPSLFALFVGGERVMLSTIDVPDFDSTLGAPIMPALLTILVTATIYYLALLFERGAGREPRLDGS